MTLIIKGYSFNLLKWFAVLAVVLISITSIYEIWPERPTGQVIKEYDGIKGVSHSTPDLKVHFWYKGDLFATRGLSVFRSKDKGISWEKVAVIGEPEGSLFYKIRRHILDLRIVLKLRHELGISRLRIFQDNIILAFYAGVFRGTITEGEVVRLENTDPLVPSLLLQGLTQDNKGNIYVGEYITSEHSFTHLYRSQDQGKTWNVIYKFPRTEIRHIHSVTYDPFSDLLWLTTGDSNNESQILYSNDYGASFRTLGSGNQNWRTVSLQFTPEAIYWGSDKENNNHLFMLNRDTGHMEVLFTVANPFYYSINDRNGNLFFATTIEKPEIGKFGSQFAELWKIPFDNKSPVRLISWQKGKLKQHGKIEFAQGDPPAGWIAFTPINLTGHHYEAVVMEINK